MYYPGTTTKYEEMLDPWYYGYEDLIRKIRYHEKNNLNQHYNINCLFSWFQEFGRMYWNGEIYETEEIVIQPIHKEIDEDRFEIEYLEYFIK